MKVSWSHGGIGGWDAGQALRDRPALPGIGRRARPGARYFLNQPKLIGLKPHQRSAAHIGVRQLPGRDQRCQAVAQRGTPEMM